MNIYKNIIKETANPLIFLQFTLENIWVLFFYFLFTFFLYWVFNKFYRIFSMEAYLGAVVAMNKEWYMSKITLKTIQLKKRHKKNLHIFWVTFLNPIFHITIFARLLNENNYNLCQISLLFIFVRTFWIHKIP